MNDIKSKNLNSALNAISAIGSTLVNGLLGIVVTKLVISYFGSDFNGLNSTANQIINMLLIVEGGFTLASNVALFYPISQKDYDSINGILAATKEKFKKVGTAFFLLGIVVSIVYAFFVKTQLSKEFVATIIIMAVVPQATNLFFASKYRVLLQAEQKEYILSTITMVTVGLSHITNIVVILNCGKMWMVRAITMLFSLINCIVVCAYVNKKYDFIDFDVEPKYEHIEGTHDVMIQKITSVIYGAFPVVFLSVSPIAGTVVASIYAVYNSVFAMLKSCLHALIDAPRLSLGLLLSEKEKKDVWNVFKEYEYLAIFVVFVLLLTCNVLILPFIELYTRGVTDANYYDNHIALLMVIITSIEMLHIPSGHLINMAGEFKISKIFQIVACVLLMISMIIGGNIFGIYGILSALLITAIALAVMELGYVHLYFFDNKIFSFIKMAVPLIVAGIVLSYLEKMFIDTLENYLMFVVCGLALTSVNFVFGFVVSYLFNKTTTINLFYRVKSTIKNVLK